MIQRAFVAVLAIFSLSSLSAKAYSFPRKAPAPVDVPPPLSGLGDPMRTRAWHLDALGLPEAWKKTKGSHETFIALVDSGVDYNHPDLAANILRNSADPMDGLDNDKNAFLDDFLGWDFTHNRGLPMDGSGHGTFLSSLMVSVEDNGIGTMGVCPKCAVLPIRFLNSQGLGDTANGVKGIRYALSRHARIINLSFAGEGKDADLFKALQEAGRADALVLVASGNDGLRLDHESIYPAKYHLDNLITVAAADQHDVLWKGSNWSENFVDIAVPGTDLIGIWENGWDTGDGTSDATAVMSACAALLLDANKKLRAAELKQILLRTARKAHSLEGKVRVGGMVDMAAAMTCATNGLQCLK